jgi:hypothetical protein
MEFFIPTPEQRRRGRKAALLSQKPLAVKIKRSLDVVRRLESGNNASIDALQAYLNELVAAGVKFFPDGSISVSNN